MKIEVYDVIGRIGWYKGIIRNRAVQLEVQRDANCDRYESLLLNRESSFYLSVAEDARNLRSVVV